MGKRGRRGQLQHTEARLASSEAAMEEANQGTSTLRDALTALETRHHQVRAVQLQLAWEPTLLLACVWGQCF